MGVFGAIFGSQFLVGTFPPAWAELDIQTLEPFPEWLVATFANALTGRSLAMHCDNFANFTLITIMSESITVLNLYAPSS